LIHKGNSQKNLTLFGFFNGNHEVSYVEDKRSSGHTRYYGNVKIGSQWWFQSNLGYIPPEDISWSSAPYLNDNTFVRHHGVLYPWKSLTSSGIKPCPKGWHVPSIDEWELMMKNLGFDASIPGLQFGGASELHFMLSGQRGYNGVFSHLGEYSHFWTSSTSPLGQPYVWYFDPGRGKSQKVIMGKTTWLSIRCVRND